MSKPLFTDKELAAHSAQIRDLEKLHGDRRKAGYDFNAHWAEKEAVRNAHGVETIKRAQARSEEFLNGLIILVGYRGSHYIPFLRLFADSDADEMQQLVAQYDVPEVRRSLYTILRALTEVPRSWGMSAFVRFLRGTGKQSGAKYHGAGAFGTGSGWKAKEIGAICSIVVSDHYATGYASCLMTYDDTYQEIRDAEDEDYTIEHDTKFKASRVTRDVEFITKLCDMLETRGLAEVPKPKSKAAKTPRTPKVFKSGDLIRAATIRDLPLPAHVRIPIMRRNPDEYVWTEAHIEHVVLKLEKTGYYKMAKVAKSGTAYQGQLRYEERKSMLEGATYLGPWSGKVEKKDLSYKYVYKKRDS